jgi:hypothetical protein
MTDEGGRKTSEGGREGRGSWGLRIENGDRLNTGMLYAEDWTLKRTEKPRRTRSIYMYTKYIYYDRSLMNVQWKQRSSFGSCCIMYGAVGTTLNPSKVS